MVPIPGYAMLGMAAALFVVALKPPSRTVAIGAAVVFFVLGIAIRIAGQ